MKIPANLEEIEKTKSYDLVMAVPLILWFGWSAIKVRPTLAWDAAMMLRGRADLLIVLQFLALFASACFSVLLIWLLIERSVPVKKSKGLLPRLCGFAGTFLGVGILQLDLVNLSLPWQALADLFVLGGSLGSVLVLSRLGKAFSIMPEARLLVTSGPYAYARHPLYAVEAITVVGIAMQHIQPWATLLGIGTIALQVARSIFEERVLVEAYPEYEAYRARTRRFIPGII
jgi:protein-S-isoprenylcysteine O-methyltransferase Ste14